MGSVILMHRKVAINGQPRQRGVSEIVGYALVDKDDFASISSYRWFLIGGAGADGNRYACAWVDGKRVMMHRFIMGLQPGDAREIDHLNHNRLDNRRENLRAVTLRENRQNMAGWTNSSSCHRGVSWDKRSQKWEAYICPGGKKKFLGYFESEEDAARVAQSARLRDMEGALA